MKEKNNARKMIRQNNIVSSSIPFKEAERFYLEQEVERIRFEIARIGSEGLCPHCKHQEKCDYSTTTIMCACSRYACDGIMLYETHDGLFHTKMKYVFEYQDELERKC